jgi:hypothetical protein
LLQDLLNGKKDMEGLKGVCGLYEYCCDNVFYEWIIPTKIEMLTQSIPIFSEARISWAPVWYNDAEAFSLAEDKYDPFDEYNSTWKLTTFDTKSRGARLPRPYKVFNLETDDDLIVHKCKIRPVVMIKNISTDWRVPDKYFHNAWLCMPVFSYKPRHSQKYVLADQSLSRPHHFYLPPGNPGFNDESVGMLSEIQFIPENNFIPFKKFCTTHDMQLPFRLSEKAFHTVLGHISRIIPTIEISGYAREWYEYFLELVTEQINEI